MLKNISNLGSVLNKAEQKTITGGTWVCRTILDVTICYDDGINNSPSVCIENGLPGSGTSPGFGCGPLETCVNGQCV